MFSSRSFIVSGLMFRSLIHFEFIFVIGVRKCSSFILLQVVDQISQHHLLKRWSLIHCIFLPPLSKITNPQLSCLLHRQAGSLPLVPPGEPSSTLRVFISPNHLINPMMLPGYFHDAHFIDEKLRLWDLQCLNQGICLVRGRAWAGPSCAWLCFCFDMGVVGGCCLVCAQFTDEETEAGSVSKVPTVRETGPGLQRKAARIQRHLHRPAGG